MSLTVLVVEDEPKVQAFIQKSLEQAGMQVECLSNLDDLEATLERVPVDVLVLDRLLGSRDSLPLVPQLRRKFPATKVLFLSALGELDDRVAGLDLGADDYLTKPFHVAELVARVRTLSRRPAREETTGSLMKIEDLEILLNAQEVRRAGKQISLTSKEFKLLTLLAQKPKKIFSKMELLDRVWGVNSDPGSNVVEVTMNRLRSKIDDEFEIALIHTKRGSGYWFGKAGEGE